jgi:cytochrome c-type biogenesis protein
MLAIAFLLVSPSIAAQDNIVSTSHSPEYPFPGEAIAVSLVVNDSSNITNVRLLYCQIEPLYLCYTPSLNMSYIGGNTYTTSITEHLEDISRLGYNITITYDDGSKEYSPKTGPYNYVNITGGDTTSAPCPTESTLAIQVLIVCIVVIIAFLIFKQMGARRKEQKPNKKMMTVLVVVIILLSVVALALFLWSQGSSEVKEATNFTLTDIDGNTFSLNDYRGKVVLLDMMSIDCESCKIVEKDLKDIYPEYEDDVVFISIDILADDTDEMLRDYRDDHDIEWIIARDTDEVILKYNAQAIPKVIIINKDGYATYENNGLTDKNTLKNELDSAISGEAQAIAIQQAGFVSLAILAGIASFFSPCAFPMLPGYMAFYLKKFSESAENIQMRKAVMAGSISALGIIIVYLIIGGLVVVAGTSMLQYLGYLGLIVGIILIALGALLFTPLQYWKIVRPFQTLWSRLRNLGKKKSEEDKGISTTTPGEQGFYGGLFAYGVGYGAAAAGCTAPLFVAVMLAALVSGTLLLGILILFLYTASAALLMLAVTLIIAYFGAGAAQKLAQYTEVIKKISGAVLVVVGVYLVWFYFAAA